MSDMPETIWADAPDIFDGMSLWASSVNDRGTEYVRADLERARVTAAYEAAATTATFIVAACNWTEDAERNDVLAEGALAAQSHCASAIRALTPADASAALERLLAEARAQVWLEAAGMFHTEQVRIWAQEIIEGLALANVLRVETYDEKVDAFSAVQRELLSIAAAIRARGEAATTQEGGE